MARKSNGERAIFKDYDPYEVDDGMGEHIRLEAVYRDRVAYWRQLAKWGVTLAATIAGLLIAWVVSIRVVEGCR